VPQARARHAPGLSIIARQRLWLFGAAGAAWAALLLHTGGWLPPALCVSPLSGGSSRFIREWEAFVGSSLFFTTVQAWGLMLAAMMLPLLASPLLQLTLQSFPRRRNEARVLFLAGYALTWTAALTVILALLLGVRSLGIGEPVRLAQPVLFAAAAWWQGTAWKRRALAACHRPGLIQAFGWQASWDSFRFGLSHGSACVANCWFAMAAMSFGIHSIVPALALAIVFFAERNDMRPQIRASQVILLLLGVSASVPG